MFIMLLLMVCPTISAQPTPCPGIPTGISNVSNISWDQDSGHVIVGIDQHNENRFLQLWLQWEIETETIKLAHLPNTIMALQIVDTFGLHQEFLSNEIFISLSPSGENAIYFTSGEIYKIDTRTMERTVLGEFPIHTIIETIWLSDENILIVHAPPEGIGYGIIQLCLQEDCRNNISENIGSVIGRPSVSSDAQKLAVYDIATNNLLVYSLLNNSVLKRIALNGSLLGDLPPYWSTNNGSVYVMGLNEDVDMKVFQINLVTGEFIQTISLGSELAQITPANWLFSETKQYIVLSSQFDDRKLHLQCF